ncbi:hypothetical protein [Dyadobacter linearis]|uniref:hypothetical protein n=1 Tax=Dyadobacter linearis TaxID=2823330 RepID=UPI001BFCC63D|nr:hypothetical protein [Dyadobacter sp. CECT 9623]
MLRKFAGLNSLLNYPCSFALTISLASYLHYLSLLFRIDYRLLLAVPILVTGLTGWLYFKDIKSKSLPPLQAASNLKLLVMAVAALVLTTGFNQYVYRWGDWDAWAIWNLHAKFLFHPEYWTNLFLYTDKLRVTHPDYPLMLPSLIAFIWRGLGTIIPFVPIAIAHLVLLAIPLTVFLALNRFGHLFSAAIALAIFALDTKFINVAGSQYADTLLALFILVTFIIYKETTAGGNAKLLVLLGFFAGSATWVKNEGQLFFVVFSFLFLLQNLRKPVTVLRYVAGALIPLLILLHFKFVLAPANDLVHASRGAELLDLIASPMRYLLIAKYLLLTAFEYYWIVILLSAIVLFNKIPFVRTFPFAVITMVLLGYFAVYLTTPHDLTWHLEASTDRLLHHIYPACIYLMLLKLSATSKSDFWAKWQ